MTAEIPTKACRCRAAGGENVNVIVRRGGAADPAVTTRPVIPRAVLFLRRTVFLFLARVHEHRPPLIGASLPIVAATDNCVNATCGENLGIAAANIEI